MPGSMLPISVSELAHQMTDILALTPDTCTITRPTGQASDAAGGFTEGYTTVASGVVCNVFPARGLSSLADDVQQTDKGVVLAQWLIQLPIGTDVKNRDRITPSSGRVFEVITSDLGESYNVILSVKATLVE
jgi:hypothetical protein